MSSFYKDASFKLRETINERLSSIGGKDIKCSIDESVLSLM